MCRIVFECADQAGDAFTVSMESETAVIGDTIAETVQAWRRSGIEVISATRMEEMPVDVNLYAPAPARAPLARVWNRFRPVWLLEKGALAAGLALSIVGFDDGFSATSIVSHVDKLFPAVGHMIQAIV